MIVATGAPVQLTADGPTELAVSVMHDVTEHAKAERLRDQFFAAAAHALKTPVSVINAHAQLWAARSKSTHDLRAAEAIERQCGKLDRMTQNMLVLTRLHSTSLELHPERVDCAGIVEAVARDMKHASVEHRVVAAVEARPTIFADPERIAQAFRVLIDMALRRARPRNDIAIAVDEPDGHARVRVMYQDHTLEHAVPANEGAGYEGLQLERHLVDALVAGAGGTFGSKSEATGRCTDWVELPTAVSDRHA